MTVTDILFFILGAIGALISGVVLIRWGFNKKSHLWTSAKIVYASIGLVEVYNGLIYILVLAQVLPHIGYGVWIRPLSFISYMAPLLVAIIHRKGGAKTI